MRSRDLAIELLKNPEFEVYIDPTTPDMRFEREPLRTVDGVTAHQGRETIILGVKDAVNFPVDPLEDVPSDGGMNGIIQGWK